VNIKTVLGYITLCNRCKNALNENKQSKAGA